MGKERRSSLALMHFHYDVIADVSEMVINFADRFPWKLQQNGLFYES